VALGDSKMTDCVCFSVIFGLHSDFSVFKIPKSVSVSVFMLMKCAAGVGMHVDMTAWISRVKFPQFKAKDVHLKIFGRYTDCRLQMRIKFLK